MTDTAEEREKRPAFLFYAARFLSSAASATLSPEAGWAYVHLLSHQWLQNGLPMEPKKLAAMAKLTPAKFRKVWADELEEYFEEIDGRLFNPSLEEIRADATNKTNLRRSAAKSRWEGGASNGSRS